MRKVTQAEKKKANTAWSAQIQRKEAKELRREKRLRKKKWLQSQTQATCGLSSASSLKRGRKDKANGSSDDDDDVDAWDELAREERMAKKVKKGVINQKVFDAEFGISLS